MSTIGMLVGSDVTTRLRAAAAENAASYITIPGVEIASVGMDWHASTGDITITLQHLADAVEAANNDPHILSPRLKIGNLEIGYEDHGGAPAFGRVENLRLENDGAILVGDYVGMPDWLAAAAPSAYPSRSIEGDLDVETKGGKRYALVITAVALLGEDPPAIEDLEDLKLMLAQGPDAVRERHTNLEAGRQPMAVKASASADVVQQAFWSDVAVDERYWWWPREMWVDRGQIIADDDEGHLFSVGFTTDADGNVTFEDPVAGVLDFRALPTAVAASSRNPDRVYASAADARPRDRVRANNVNEGGTMSDDERTQLATKLGLPEDATQEQIDEKLRADALAAQTDDTPPVETDDEPATPAEPQAVAASAVTVDKEKYEQLERDARMGREARETQLEAARSQFIDEAVKAGKFPPSRREHYTALMAADEQGTRDLVDKLAAGVIPVEQRGVGANTGENDTTGQLELVRAGLGLKTKGA